MKKYEAFAVFIIALMFLPLSGCGNTVEEENFPFEFKLVIRGVLEEGMPVQNIYIGRTMPIQDSVSQVFSYLPNVSAAIIVGDNIYRLYHRSNGNYENTSITVKSNTTYTLVASWEDQTATASTEVPMQGSFTSPEAKVSIRNNLAYYTLETQITPFGNEAYAALWQIYNISGTSLLNEGRTTGPVVRKTPVSGPTITLPTEEFNGLTTSNKAGMRVFVYDGAFYDYYMTQNPNQVTDLTFGQPQAGVKWNVTGDGIGMFVARKVIVVK